MGGFLLRRFFLFFVFITGRTPRGVLLECIDSRKVKEGYVGGQLVNCVNCWPRLLKDPSVLVVVGWYTSNRID